MTARGFVLPAAAGIFLAALFALPAAGDLWGFQFPLAGLIAVPATGLTYLAVFFHEIGHALFGWVFGYPSMPTFDFNHGGGMAYAGEQSRVIHLIVTLCLAMSAGWLWKQQLRVLSAATAVLTAFQVALYKGLWHEAVILYMGHGTEILVGAFCLWRGLSGNAVSATERYLNAIFGFFVFFAHFIFAYGLVTDDVAREIYDGQKGGHGFGDFSRVAEIAGADVPDVAGFSLAFSLAAFIAALAAAVWAARRPS